jgi:hypothetical protein
MRMPRNGSDDEGDSWVLIGTPLADLLPGICIYINLKYYTGIFISYDEF